MGFKLTSRRVIDSSVGIVLFLALFAFAIAIAGATAFVIFWPLALVHVRDRHPQITAQLGEGAFLKPRALWWLLRGDYQSRMNGYAVGRQNGWLSSNDIRELENLNRIPDELGGDLYLINGNMTKLADAGAFAPNNAKGMEGSK